MDKNKIVIKDLCNQGLEYYSKEDKNKAIKRYRNLYIDCKTKDAVVTVKDGLR